MNKTLSLLGVALFVALGLLVGIGQVFQPNLDSQGHLVLLALITSLGIWIFKPFGLPFAATSCLFMAALLIIGVPAANVLSGFSGNAVWSLIPALFFGFALAKTGLGKRIAYFCMKSIKVTYPTLLLTWLIIGVVLSMLTPSITVRVVIVIPIAMQCVEVCKLPEGSKGRSLVLLTAWAMAVIPGVGWLTGSLMGFQISGIYETIPGVGAISFGSWLEVSLLPTALITVLTLVLGYVILRPEEGISLGREVFRAEYAKLGPVSVAETVTGIILLTCFLLFATRSAHGIPDVAVCLLGFFVLCLTQCVEVKDLGTGISWDLVIFLGCAMGFASVFAATGVSEWMSGVLIDALAPLAWSPWLFIFGVLIFMFIWRFVDIATFVPTIAIVCSVSLAVFEQYGIDPLIWVPLLCIALNSFFFSYTNLFALVGEANTNGRGWTPRHLTSYGTGYFVASMLAMLVAIPYWIALGMFNS